MDKYISVSYTHLDVYKRQIQNYFGVQIYMDMPEGYDYDLTLYDEYGNQVGKAEWDLSLIHILINITV